MHTLILRYNNLYIYLVKRSKVKNFKLTNSAKRQLLLRYWYIFKIETYINFILLAIFTYVETEKLSEKSVDSNSIVIVCRTLLLYLQGFLKKIRFYRIKKHVCRQKSNVNRFALILCAALVLRLVLHLLVYGINCICATIFDGTLQGILNYL